MRQLFVRSALTASLPLILGGTFLIELSIEFLRAFRCAWLAVRVEYDSYLKLMQKEL